MTVLADLLKRIEIEDQEESHWIVGPKTGHMLHWLVRVMNPNSILEIGTSVGYSALWMASALEQNGGGKLWTVESHQERFDKATQHFKEAGLDHRIVQIKGHAPEVLMEGNEVPDQVDFVFMDATKKEHPLYFEAVLPRLKSGSYLVVDNVESHRFGEMKKFIAGLHEDLGLKVVEIPVGDGLLIARVV